MQFDGCALAALETRCPAAVKLPAVIGDNMVLQRGQPVPIWGWADKGEEVTVTVAGQKHVTKAGDDGRWKVTLDKLGGRPAVGNDRQRLVRQYDHVEEHRVGEVWVCSGQSNMEMGVAGVQERRQGDRRRQLSTDPICSRSTRRKRRSRPPT